uniref:Uncharacterized protein n=1 Tax=Odontella aurita TaxID=265563 RepID=A0A7S4MN82_9STRA|mmetsp:Transcript_26593/g.78647  ORF Transcript_26593/g.78647 Transcript_26593/m.78647 type:complete len:248 (+) Transcript_26593:100-843(+)
MNGDRNGALCALALLCAPLAGALIPPMADGTLPTFSSQLSTSTTFVHMQPSTPTALGASFENGCNDDSTVDRSADLSARTRRSVLASGVAAAAASSSSLLGIFSVDPRPAFAAYGDSSTMELPNYIEFLIEKNKKDDPDKILYKGADSEVQLRRLLEASSRLPEIPGLASAKKWSQVQGVLTGPLGTLIQTMNTVGKDSTEAKKAAALVKQDVLAISQEASKKSEAGCVKATEAATRDLEAFVKLVF